MAKSCRILASLTIAGSILAFGGARAEAPVSELEKIQSQFESHRELTRRPLNGLGNQYREALVKLQNEMQENANLDGLVIVKNEIQRFDEEKAPASDDSKLSSVARLQKIYRDASETESAKIEATITAAHTAYQEKLENLMRKLTTEGKAQAALQVRAALEAHAAERSKTIDLERGLVLHFRFEGDTDEIVRDSSDARNDGQLMGDAKILSTSGNRGRHALLDGRGDFIEISHRESLAFSTDGTISIWVRPKRMSAMHGLISKYHPVSSWTMRNWEGAEHRRIGFGDHNHNIVSVTELKADQWTHVVATVRDGEVSIYLNGKLDSEGTRPSPLGINDNPVRIGSCYNGRYFNGAVDDVRIYSRGLSSKEVARLFASES